MKTFTIPSYVHDLIAASRAKFGRNEWSDKIDEMLKILESRPDKPYHQSEEDLAKEAQFRLPGFKFTVMMPGRVGGKVGPILSRNYYMNLFAYLQRGNLQDLIALANDESFPDDLHPLHIAEMMAFLEIFPESIAHSLETDEDFQWWRRPSNFEPRLKILLGE